MSEIGVVGIWHQGAVLCAGLASLGHKVRGVANRETAAQLSRGDGPVYEPGLRDLLLEQIADGRLVFTDDLAVGLNGAEFVFLSEDTVIDESDRPRLGSVRALARAIGESLQQSVILCVTAQVPVGTTEVLAGLASRRFEAKAAYVPEFLRLGTALASFLNPDRIAIGAADEATAERVAGIFESLGRPFVLTDVRSAELSKHGANAFLASSISFANELADLARAAGADLAAVVDIMKRDKRIGEDAYLTSGLGYSGGTLGRDVRVLQALGRDAGVPTPLLDAVGIINQERLSRVVRTLQAALGPLSGKRVALLGLTYKRGTSTLRGSPGIAVAIDLARRGAFVRAYDPLADLSELSTVPPFEVAAHPLDAAHNADAVVAMGDWKEADRIDARGLRKIMTGALVVDARGVLDRRSIEAAGLRYERL